MALVGYGIGDDHVARIGEGARGDHGMITLEIVIDAILLKVMGACGHRQQERQQ